MLLSPMAGWLSGLDEVPDEVFAGQMMGDGLAIEPLDDVLRAPCDATVVAVAATRHAVTLRLANGAELLLHLGLETVALGGEGMITDVTAGQAVTAGAPLLRFDIDAVARRARSLITPIVVINGDAFTIELDRPGRLVASGEPVARIRTLATPAPSGVGEVATEAVARREVIVPLANGLHARPAARLAARAKEFASALALELGGRQADLRSPVAVMTLGVQRGDRVAVVGAGPDAASAIDAVASLIEDGMGEAGPPPAAPPTPVPAAVGAPGIVTGLCAAPGLAVGEARQLPQPSFDVPAWGADPSHERAELQRALAVVAEQLARGPGGDIMAAHQALLSDPELAAVAFAGVERGQGAGAAWRAATRAIAEQLRATGNPLLAERAADLRDLENRVLAELLGEALPTRIDVPAGTILLADELLPSQFAALDARQLSGICTARGGTTSHVAILAASAAVPMVVAAGDRVGAIADGTPLILDAYAGQLHIAPDESRLAATRQSIEVLRQCADAELAAAQAPGRTSDGRRVEIFANLGSPDDATGAVALGAEGCGLLRSEFLFLDRRSAPDVEEQRAAYQAVADRLEGRPLIVRTLDVGGDKPVPYLVLEVEENPALGLRGIRLCLARPELLEAQLTAILRVQPPGQCRIMVPMVTSPDELRAVRSMLDKLRSAETIAGDVQLGVMIETPAAAVLADQLAAEADFLSIGTNDLAQYTLAMDRGHTALADQVDALHPAVLRLVEQSVAGARRHGRYVGVCGGLAADPAATAILVGLGVDELSVVPTAIPALKARVRALNSDECHRLATRALALDSAEAVRALVAEAAAPTLEETH